MQLSAGQYRTTEIGERVFQLRTAAEWGQRDLAREAKVSPTTIVHIETGQVPVPRLSTLRKISKAFGLGSVEELTNPAKKVPARSSVRQWLDKRAGHHYLSLSNEDAFRFVSSLALEDISLVRDELRDELEIVMETLRRDGELPPEMREALKDAERAYLFRLQDLAKQRSRLHDRAARQREYQIEANVNQ
jgi:transcriptional regulator with XRE-family HTH domain